MKIFYKYLILRFFFLITKFKIKIENIVIQRLDKELSKIVYKPVNSGIIVDNYELNNKIGSQLENHFIVSTQQGKILKVILKDCLKECESTKFEYSVTTRPTETT